MREGPEVADRPLRADCGISVNSEAAPKPPLFYSKDFYPAAGSEFKYFKYIVFFVFIERNY